jgi:succinyl-CoA synthetase alpha subunit
MGIIIDENTQAIVQGIKGIQGSLHSRLMPEYGTKNVAGVTPGKGGADVHGVPVYDTVKEAQEKHSPNASIIFVPAPFAANAALEAIDSGIQTIVIVTEHLPIRDSVELVARAQRSNATIIGPNTPWNNHARTMQAGNNARARLHAWQRRHGV